MYYRIAIQVDGLPAWRWKSTVLNSLQPLFQLLRLYRSLPQERLRVFSARAPQHLGELLERLNNGQECGSVPLAQFLREHLLHVPEVTEMATARVTRKLPETSAIAVAVEEPMNRGNSFDYAPSSVSGVSGVSGVSCLDIRRLELEMGAGGDSDIPYHFSLPVLVPQTLAWMRLLAKIQRGTLQP